MLLSNFDAKSINVCSMVRFGTATLFSFDLSSKFLKSLLATLMFHAFFCLHRRTHGSGQGGILLFPMEAVIRECVF